MVDDPALAKKRRDEINLQNDEKRKELRRNVLGMIEASTVKDKMEIHEAEELENPHAQQRFEDMSGTEKVMYIIDLPFMILTYLTILPTHKSHFSKLRCLIWCVTGVSFIMFVTTGKPSMKWVFIGAPAAVILLALFYFTIPDTKGEHPKQGI